MENASKALLIAAAVLIVIILISFGMIILNSTQDTAEHAQGVGSSISDSTEKATSKLLGIFGKTGKNEGEVIKKGSLKHNGTVPEGGSYYIAALGTTIAAGEEMPDAPGNGDEYTYGDYLYTYCDVCYDEYGDVIARDGWGVLLVEEYTRTTYGEILEEINGSAIIDMTCTFASCEALITAPTIPKSVKILNSTFELCESLKTAPDIPEGIIDMSSTFINCKSLVTAPAIPNSVTTMNNTFAACTSLETAPKIPDSVTDMFGTFQDCTSLETAPAIPDSVTYMSYTFAGCTLLTTAPAIPDSVTYMQATFKNCRSLTTAPDIPSSVENMGLDHIGMTGTFVGCTALTGEIKINANPSAWRDCFAGTIQDITITGDCSEQTKQRLAGTAESGKVTWK